MTSSDEVIRRLLDEGWVEKKRKRGSHRQFRKVGNPNKVTVAHPTKDLPVGTLKSIYRAAGWTWPPR